jgi:hypothetical protein
MKKILMALTVLSTSILSSCSVTTTSYDPGPTYSTYTVGYDYYRPNPGYYWGPRWTGMRYYDSDFYVGDRVFYGPRYHRNVWRAW